jgi:PAS domain S-box-containing protein
MRTGKLAAVTDRRGIEVISPPRKEPAGLASETESHLIVDGIPGLVALIGPTGEVEFVNRKVLQYCGKTLAELRHWRSNDFVHPEDLPHVIDVFTRSIASGTSYEIVQRLRRFDGVYRWFRAEGSPLRDPSGRVLFANIQSPGITVAIAGPWTQGNL